MKRKHILLLLLGFFTLLVRGYAADANFDSTHFSGSGNCAQCHNGLTDNNGKDISIIKNWSTSMMANSTRDPYWRAKVASELHRNPSVADEINDKCSRCHAPMANDAMKKEGQTVNIFDNGFLNTASAYHDAALDGVSCSACHQITDDGNLGTLESFSGNYTITAYANKVDRPAYGQYSNPFTRPMQNEVQFTPQYGSHMGKSELCATCHNVKTPFVDATGKIVSTTLESEFPEQMPYSEWNHSAFKVGGAQEKSCQSCHMPKVAGDVKIASIARGRISARPNFAQHTFLGANTMMMDILNTNRSEINVTAIGFEQSILDARQFLQSSASLEIVSKEIIANKLKVTLKVNNKAGHKLPTSYPSRRAFIHFLVKDDKDITVFESGKVNPNGSIVGVESDTNSSHYEPHYDQISSADQVQVYEPVMQDTDGNVTHTLMRASAYIKDNRLLPAGFNKATAPNDIAVKGAALSDTNFTQGGDTIVYLIDIADQASFTIQAELKYQTIAYAHIQDMFKDATAVSQVATFKRYFDNTNVRSETLATVTANMTRKSINNAPIASNSSINMVQNTAVSGQLIASDSDSAVLSYQIVADGTKGTAVINNQATGSFIYTPKAEQTGLDSFTFNVSDGDKISNTATVSVTIATAPQKNISPIAVNDFMTTLKNRSEMSVNVLSNDIDADGDTLVITAFDTVSQEDGKVKYNGGGIFTYTPATDFIGQDRFTYTISDGNGGQAVAVVNIDVTSSENCFIATAAFGSYLSSDVRVLRQFRDEYLLSNTVGRYFVAFYYENSPPIANYIATREELRTATRWVLTPLIYAIKYPFGFFGITLLLILIWRKRRFVVLRQP